MDTRLGYIGGAISLVLAFFPENNLIKAAFAGVGIFAFLVAYVFHERKSSKIGKLTKSQNIIVQQQPIDFTSTNVSIIKEVKENTDQLISTPLVKSHVSSQSQKVPTQQEPFELSSNNISIFKVFRVNDRELISVPLIEQLTGLETIVINSSLDDLKNHKLINATNLDEFNGGWQYQLTAEGRKLVRGYPFHWP